MYLFTPATHHPAEAAMAGGQKKYHMENQETLGLLETSQIIPL